MKSHPYMFVLKLKRVRCSAEENNEYFARKTGRVKCSFIGLSPKDQYLEKIPAYCHKMSETFHGGEVFLHDYFH